MKNSRLSSSGLSESDNLDQFLRARDSNEENMFLRHTRVEPKLEEHHYMDYYDQYEEQEEEQQNPYGFEIKEDREEIRRQKESKNKYLEKKREMEERKAQRVQQEKREQEQRLRE